MGTAEQFLRPEVIQSVARLDLKARFIVEGFIAGLHDSPFQGFSTEFSEHRKYAHGDDLKDIDWNVYARTDRYYVKKFQAETNLSCYLVVDVSESMMYRYGRGLTKLEYATCLAASLGYLMSKQQDAVGLVTFDEDVTAYLPPRTKRGHLTAIIGLLSRAPAGRKTHLPQSLHHAAELIRDRGLVVIFSDLLCDLDPLLDSLHHFRYKGHDVIVFHILDEAEAKFPFEGPIRFQDVEGPDEIAVDARAVKRAYLDELHKFTGALESRCAEAQMDYVQVDTSVGFDKVLMSYLIARRARF